ncbi:MAG: DUF58 domain-containing protein [Chitinophagales bacterium]
MRRFFRQLYLSNRFFTSLIGAVFLFLFAYQLSILLPIAQITFLVLLLLLGTDMLLLYRHPKALFARRDTPEKMSNGDDNELQIYLENNYPFDVYLEIIDELPLQFQLRHTVFDAVLTPQQTKIIAYKLRPTERGNYHFGAVNVYAKTVLGLVKRRYQFSQDKMVAVYPSFIQMRQYELLANSNKLQQYGIKKIRRIGHSMEFEQIKTYVTGDDYRVINWKATARRNELMINQFQEEKAQPVYALIDKGRVMEMPFEGLSLLDYAINTSLVILNIALKKGDKSGLLTFSEKIDQIVPAHNRNSQLKWIQDVLYNQQTSYKESSYEQLYITIRRKINQRSLLLLFTNFNSLSGLERQLPYLRQIAKFHQLVVIFFENTELEQITKKTAGTTEVIYQQIVAEKFKFEKKRIVQELQKYGIQTLLTTPKTLSISTINKYLELKSRGLI